MFIKSKNNVLRKFRKLKRDPKLFFEDSKAYINARKTVYIASAKLGTFAFVLLISLCVVIYYTAIASPRYVSAIQFVVKQNKTSNAPIAGLASLSVSSPQIQDSQILKTYIESPDMALVLDNLLELKAYYQKSDWDIFSRLDKEATYEEYVAYYKDHLSVKYDELSEVLLVEIEGFDEQFTLKLSQTLLKKSQDFINNLGSGMTSEQANHAESEVIRAYHNLKKQQQALINFQGNFNLLNAETQTTNLQSAINTLEAKVINQQAELKSLQAYMRADAPEIKSKQYEISALSEQLTQEKQKLISNHDHALNHINAKYKEIELNSKLALDLYESSLASLESIRVRSFENIRYLLLIQKPHLAEEETYPRRLYAITTWFLVLTLIYLMIKLIVLIIQERRD